MHPQTLERRLPPSQLQRQHRQHSIRALVDIHSCKSMTQSFAPPRFSSAYRMSDVAPEHYGRPQHPPMPLSSIVAGHARPPPTQVSAAVVLSRSPSPTSANFRPDKVLLRIYSPIPTRHHLPRHLPSLRHETRLPPGARLPFPKSWSLDLLVTVPSGTTASFLNTSYLRCLPLAISWAKRPKLLIMAQTGAKRPSFPPPTRHANCS